MNCHLCPCIVCHKKGDIKFLFWMERFPCTFIQSELWYVKIWKSITGKEPWSHRAEWACQYSVGVCISATTSASNANGGHVEVHGSLSLVQAGHEAQGLWETDPKIFHEWTRVDGLPATHQSFFKLFFYAGKKHVKLNINQGFIMYLNKCMKRNFII